MYVYIYSQTDNLFVVGFFDPAGGWHPDSDHTTREGAAERVRYLNGSGNKS